MCKTPKMPAMPEPVKQKEYARERMPDNAYLLEDARRRANERGGGSGRSTVLGGLTSMASVAQTAARTGLRGVK